LQNRKDTGLNKSIGKAYFKLVDLDKNHYNPNFRVVLAGRRGHLPTIEQDGSVFVEANNENLIGLSEQGISCLRGKGYIDGLEFVFELSPPTTIKQYLLPDNAQDVQLLPEIAHITYAQAEAARETGNMGFFEPILESIKTYFRQANKKVYVELNEPTRKGPICFNLYELVSGIMPSILIVTKPLGASKIYLRKGPGGVASFWFEPTYPVVVVELPQESIVR